MWIHPPVSDSVSLNWDPGICITSCLIVLLVRDHTWRSMVKVKLLVTINVAGVLGTVAHPEPIEVSR